LFFRDGCVIGLSLVLRSPCIPTGISVKRRGLEIAGLGIGIRADNGRFSTDGRAAKEDGLGRDR